MKTTIGGDRLGSGNKQNVSIKNFGRSTHDISYLWRSSMSSGTLVPFMSEVGLPGDSFDINLEASVLTLPTVGPLFGSYKVQMDVFSCPIRLYNGKLHMNKLGIGMDMSQIKLPQLEMEGWAAGIQEIGDNDQINASSIFSYLNMRGLGNNDVGGLVKRQFNALSYLGYWDIYKQYYANKQEEKGVMIHGAIGDAKSYEIDKADVILSGTTERIDLLGLAVSVNLTGSTLIVSLINGNGIPNWNEVEISDNSTWMIVMDLYDTVTYNSTYTEATFTDYIGAGGNKLYHVKDSNISAQPIPAGDGSPQLYEFPLVNIDNMRENILANVKESTAFVINKDSEAPYGTALTMAQLENDDWVFAQQFGQEGLGIKTYQSDLFNNWISTEWIDGTNGVNEVTAVAVEDGKFTIDALNLANKVYNMLNRIAISGGSYDDWLDAVYTHERAKSVESPVYQGSLIKELVFQEVVSTAEAEIVTEPGKQQPLGTLAGKGRLSGKKKGGKIKIKVDEPSYIIGIASITPKIDYSQGNKWDTNLKTMNDFHKPSLDAIGYQDLITDQMAWFDTKLDIEGTPTFKSAGKQPAWINYMTNVNQVRGNFAEAFTENENGQMFMVLNRRYENDGLNGIKDLTTYIDPSKFNHIFADTRLDAQNFWVQISNDITVRRKISAKVIPNL